MACKLFVKSALWLCSREHVDHVEVCLCINVFVCVCVCLCVGVSEGGVLICGNMCTRG